MSIMLYTVVVFYPFQHVFADEEVSPYGVHEPAPTGYIDEGNVMLYILAFALFLSGLFIVTNIYYLRNRLSQDN